MKLIIISERKSFLRKKSESYNTVIGQEDCFLEYGNNRVDIVYKSLMIKQANKILRKIRLNRLYDRYLTKERDEAVYFYIAMNLVDIENNIDDLVVLKKHNNKLALYVYDCWEPDFKKWNEYFDRIKPDYIFFAYKQSSDYFNLKYNNCFYMPQCIDVSVFKDTKQEKTRLFMQMGRLNDVIHINIEKYLRENRIENIKENYVYPKVKRESIFPDRNELINEINKTKYFVCVPKNLENPRRTGNISDVTARYFEAMACKTLIIGKKPKTYDELFLPNSMIEFDDTYKDFKEKIEYYEKNSDIYWKTINDNYDYLLKNHTWNNRLEDILKIVNKEGQKL